MSSVLITKFGKARKIGGSGFLFQIVWFRQFQNMNRTGGKLKDWKIFFLMKQEEKSPTDYILKRDMDKL
jgi:hypothetical protein